MILEKFRWVLAAYTAAVRALVFVLACISGLAILTMMATTCLDVVLRIFGIPLKGAFDIVRICGALAIACAIPYTTAVKGHVAIEYFFHKLPRRGRVIVDTITRSLCMVLFALLAKQSVVYGTGLWRNGQVSLTLELPIFWVPYVIAFCCAVVVLVIFHNLLHPGKEMIKP